MTEKSQNEKKLQKFFSILDKWPKCLSAKNPCGSYTIFCDFDNHVW